MYAWIFRHMPGPLWVRATTGLVLVIGVLALMVSFLFPWMAQLTQFTDSTIGSHNAE